MNHSAVSAAWTRHAMMPRHPQILHYCHPNYLYSCARSPTIGSFPSTTPLAVNYLCSMEGTLLVPDAKMKVCVPRCEPGVHLIARKQHSPHAFLQRQLQRAPDTVTHRLDRLAVESEYSPHTPFFLLLIAFFLKAGSWSYGGALSSTFCLLHPPATQTPSIAFRISPARRFLIARCPHALPSSNIQNRISRERAGALRQL